MIRRRTLALALGAALILSLVALAPSPAGAYGEVYRRWNGPRTVTCEPDGSGVAVRFENQNVEFNDLPADAEFTVSYVIDGDTTTDGPFPVEQTSGTRNYAAFLQPFDSYPFTFALRLDTIVDGQVVYTSTMNGDCTADGSRTENPVNESIGYGDPYRRWISPKVLTCGPASGGQVQASIDNQDVEFNNLPADAEFTINYVRNGDTDTDGPFPVEQTNGTRQYGAFSQPFPSYPFTFLFRLDTIIDGEVVYTSTLDLSCTGDGTRTVVADDQVVGPPVTTTTTSTTPTSTSTTTPGTTTTTVPAARPAQAVQANPRLAG